MTSRERIKNCIERRGVDRTPYLRWDDFNKTDIVATWARHSENLSRRHTEWTDDWGCRWATLDTTVGQVIEHPIASAEAYADYQLPKIKIDIEGLRANRIEYPDKCCSGGTGFFFFEILEKLRGFDNALMDYVAERDLLEPFLDRLEAYYIGIVDAYAETGAVDILCMNEDLGLQDRLTISPALWRDIFKPRYKAVYDRAHEHGIKVFQHSCGYVLDILPDLDEIGVDVIELQQPDCMGIEAIAAARGNMTVALPVDIQAVMPTGDWQRIAAYQRRLFETFDSPAGGFISEIYMDTASIGVESQVADLIENLIFELRTKQSV